MTRLKKHLGQHLLTDDTLLAAIVEQAGVQAGECVLEIGPGPGTLTRHLARAVGSTGRVVAVELDRDWTPALERVCREHLQVEVHWCDVLKADLAELVQGRHGCRVVANIPYYITAPILQRLLASRRHWRRAALLMQAEVAERVCAERGREVGALSYFVQYHASPALGLRVPPTAFTPPPRVDSALLLLEPRAEPAVGDASGWLFPVIHAAFKERRKMLRRSLSGFGGLDAAALGAALERAGVRGEQRPEELDLPQLAGLAQALWERAGCPPAPAQRAAEHLSEQAP